MPRSWIWKHFLMNTSDKKATCNHCKKELSFSGGNGTLIYHLKRTHFLSEPEKTVGQSTKLHEKVIDLSCSDASGRKVTCSSAKEKFASEIVKYNQTFISEWASSSSERLCSSRRAEAIMQLLTACIVRDLQPLSFCDDGSALRELMLFMEPNFQPPCPKTVKFHLLRQFTERKNVLMTQMRGLEVCLTADGWTNSQMDGFFSIVAHYINDDWELQRVILDSPTIYGRHTAANLSEALTEVLRYWDIKVFCCTHDTAANMNAALRLNKMVRFDIGCLAHLLQLAIKDLLSETQGKIIGKIIKRVRDLVSHAKKSENFSREFRKYRDQLLPQMSNCELQIDVQTRWNSTLIMLEAFHSLQGPLDFTVKSLCNIEDKRKFLFSPREMELIGEVVDILSILRRTTDQWQGEKYVTISTVYPVAFAVVRTLKEKQNLSKECSGFRDELVDNIEHRLSLKQKEFLGSMSVHTIASFLDPRFKQLCFVGEEIASKIREVVEGELSNTFHQESVDNEIRSEGMTSLSERKSFLSQLLEGTEKELIAEEEDKSEIFRYMKEKLPSFDKDPLLWWKQHSESYPKLSILARRYLAVQATSASSERLFSAFGLIYEQRRMSLTTDTANAIAFLHGNGCV